MNMPDAIARLEDDELRQMISLAEMELKNRIEKRKRDAMEQIRKIAAEMKIQVTFRAGRARAGTALKAGTVVSNPEDPSQRHVVGKGRPPAWFQRLHASGKLNAVVS